VTPCTGTDHDLFLALTDPKGGGQPRSIHEGKKTNRSVPEVRVSPVSVFRRSECHQSVYYDFQLVTPCTGTDHDLLLALTDPKGVGQLRSIQKGKETTRPVPEGTVSPMIQIWTELFRPSLFLRAFLLDLRAWSTGTFMVMLLIVSWSCQNPKPTK
jgi:hypothetical protein